MRIAFFVRGVTERDLDRSEFYAMDLQILRSLGHDVYWATGPTSITRGTDLIFCWWWTYAWLALLAALPGRIPVIATGVYDAQRYPSRSRLQRVLIAAGMRRCAMNVLVSRHEFDRLPGMFGSGIQAVYSPLAVDTDTYRPDHSAVSKRQRFLIANVTWKRATNMKRKLLPQLVQAMQLVAAQEPDARLILAGPPEDGEIELRRLSTSLDLDRVIEFRGEISRAEKVALFRTCDVYVQCSLYEGFGLAIAEAMACGAPVLVSHVGAVPEVVGAAGHYVQGNEPEQIAAGLLNLLCDPTRSELGRAGAQHIATEFSPDRRARDLGAAIDGALARKRQLS